MTKAETRALIEKSMENFHVNAGVVKKIKPRKRPKRGFTVGYRSTKGDGPRFVKEH